MKYVATKGVQPDPSRIESLGQGYTERVEFEAKSIEHAKAICGHRGLLYYGCMAEESDKPREVTND